MKRTMFGALTTLVLALVINVPAVNAQPNAKAAIPFAFNVAKTPMPAGLYTISEVSDRLMQLRNDTTNATVVVITLREERLGRQSPRLVFHKYGDRYFLAEAWGRTGDSGIEFPACPLEKELRAASRNTSAHAEEIVVALR